jgi:hypothetical protein
MITINDALITLNMAPPQRTAGAAVAFDPSYTGDP